MNYPIKETYRMTLHIEINNYIYFKKVHEEIFIWLVTKGHH